MVWAQWAETLPDLRESLSSPAAGWCAYRAGHGMEMGWTWDGDGPYLAAFRTSETELQDAPGEGEVVYILAAR